MMNLEELINKVGKGCVSKLRKRKKSARIKSGPMRLSTHFVYLQPFVVASKVLFTFGQLLEYFVVRLSALKWIFYP